MVRRTNANPRSISHPPHSSASPVELCLRVGPLALSGKKGRKSVIHTHRPSHFLNAVPTKFNRRCLAQRCDSLFSGNLISLTSLEEFTNPHYLTVTINPFSMFPHQKLSSPIPRLPKSIIHSNCRVTDPLLIENVPEHSDRQKPLPPPKQQIVTRYR